MCCYPRTNERNLAARSSWLAPGWFIRGTLAILALVCLSSSSRGAGCHYSEHLDGMGAHGGVHTLTVTAGSTVLLRTKAVRVYENGRVFYRPVPVNRTCQGADCKQQQSDSGMQAAVMVHVEQLTAADFTHSVTTRSPRCISWLFHGGEHYYSLSSTSIFRPPISC